MRRAALNSFLLPRDPANHALLFSVQIYLANQASSFSLFPSLKQTVDLSLLPQISHLHIVSNHFFRFPSRYSGADETSHCSSTHYLYNIFSVLPAATLFQNCNHAFETLACPSNQRRVLHPTRYRRTRRMWNQLCILQPFWSKVYDLTERGSGYVLALRGPTQLGCWYPLLKAGTRHH